MGSLCGKIPKRLLSEATSDNNYSQKIDLCKFASHACLLRANSLRFAKLVQNSHPRNQSEMVTFQSQLDKLRQEKKGTRYELFAKTKTAKK